MLRKMPLSRHWIMHIEAANRIKGRLMLVFGCGKKMYKVDYCGEQGFYENAKSTYKEGETVVLKYGLIATDTNYSFFLDNEPMDYHYEGGAYVLYFVMPDHDVKLECRTSNSMANKG